MVRARKTSLMAGCVVLIVSCRGSAQDPKQPRKMLRSYLTAQANGWLAERRKAVAAVTSPEQFEARRRKFREDLTRMIGGLPEARPPLAIRRTGTLDRDGYRVEKIVYQSQPDFLVTANLYVPAGKGPFPAVLHSIGHSLTAKNRAFYQTLSIGLVKHGFAVLAYDPLGQGERRIYYDRELQDSKVGSTTQEHEMAGIQSLLGGDSLARLMIWDGMRGIDALTSLPYVDAKRIGVTGCSGGGTLTTYIAALDPRVAAAAPACYITSWEDQIENGQGPQDAEQQFPDLLRLGYDHADFVESFAPKPYLICSTDQDFFPLSGAKKTYEEASRIFSLLGAPDRIAWFHEPGEHGMPRATREQIYGWMKHWLAGGPRGPATEPEIRPEHEEDLNATPTGQLATSMGGETASSMVRKRLAARPAPPPAATGLQQKVAALTRFERPRRPPEAREISRQQRERYTLTRLVLELPDRRFLPASLAIPTAASAAGAILYAGPETAASAFRPSGDLDELAKDGYTVLAVDLSGRGETASDWRSYSDTWFGSEKEAWLALMVGKTLVGMRASDIVAALDYLAARGAAGGAVAGMAKGPAAVDMIHAALFEARLGRVLLEDMLVSYAAVARSALHRHVFESVVPGSLGEYDLASLAAGIAPRPVALVNARSPLGKVLPQAAVADAYASTKARIGLRRENDSVFDAFPELKRR